MQRLYVSPDAIVADKIIICGESLRKMRTVLRMRPHDHLVVFDGSGNEYHCEIVSLSQKESELAIIRKEQPLSEPSQEIILGQALPKADKMAFIIQKAVELGISAVFPILTERTVPRYDPGRLQAKIQRWQKVALEASQQSGRVLVPEVKPVMPFDSIVTLPDSDSLKIILHKESNARPLKAILQMSSRRQPIFVLIGPEGGFTPEEIALASGHGFEVASLGSRTLRTETVALSFLSIVQYEFDERC
ncbi:MAG TPA: 16S rRNA (uracil(1498)-N(3))-methyltransferase [Thermodesulfobacteriota bacterium]|nr:16S rRNA (uracil(1498)-N(3))-methyltransferase [Thermodesulfobacteriota bacterium]